MDFNTSLEPCKSIAASFESALTNEVHRVTDPTPDERRLGLFPISHKEWCKTEQGIRFLQNVPTHPDPDLNPHCFNLGTWQPCYGYGTDLSKFRSKGSFDEIQLAQQGHFHAQCAAERQQRDIYNAELAGFFGTDLQIEAAEMKEQHDFYMEDDSTALNYLHDLEMEIQAKKQIESKPGTR